MIRTVRANFGFNGIPKGKVFTYDTEADTSVEKFIRAGMLEDVTEEEKDPSDSARTTIMVPSIETGEEVTDPHGPSEDEPAGGGADSGEADDSGGQGGVSGDGRSGKKVAKGR